ncbi:MAG: NfeD family protein [Ruminococcaceae bacterium]|nr:NfeD family protein [Oscillospiraceae bacterium]
MTPVVFWIVAFVVFLVFEAATAGLSSIWFALGALVALLLAAFGVTLWVQILSFFVVSIVTLILTRPLVLKYVNNKTTATNADRAVGEEGVVVERIDNLLSEGAVLLDGKVWTARSEQGELIEKDTLVTVLRIEGVKLIVKPTGTNM